MLKTRKDIQIADQKSKIENHEKYIKDLQTRIKLKKNSNDREEKAELRIALKKVADLVFKSPFSDEMVRAKLKELTRDYQSEN